MPGASTPEKLGFVLVTGGSGFLGAALVRELRSRGIAVRVFDVEPPPSRDNGVDFFEGDVRDRERVAAACSGVRTVFHTASIIDIGDVREASPETRRRVLSINVDGTRNVVEGMRASGARNLVYTSSNRVCIGSRPVVAGDEGLPYVSRFRDLYTESKVTAERLVLESSDSALRTCAIRPSGIWGEGDRSVLGQMIQELVDEGGLRYLLGDGTARLDNAHVVNVVHGHLLAAESLAGDGLAAGQAYFVNDGVPVNFFDFCRPLVQELGYEMPTRRLPGWAVRTLFWIWQEAHLRLGLTGPPRPPLAVSLCVTDNHFSIDKARRHLGYEPRLTPEEGMASALPYYRTYHDELKAAR